jgi:hypothetical protein
MFNFLLNLRQNKKFQKRKLYRLSFEYKEGAFEYITIGAIDYYDARRTARALFIKKYPLVMWKRWIMVSLSA